MANIFNINDKSILATASITITDQTDAATLAGGISVISGSKNQVYLTGSATPFSPDWSKQYLVIRPYLYASTIIRDVGGINEYNPDLFNPNEYPNLDAPEDLNVSSAYINTNDLYWYLRDANGTEKLINPDTDKNFSYAYSPSSESGVINDKRFLVIKGNFVPKDSFVTLICRFTFRDPYAKMFVKQSYEIDLSCLSTGLGANQLVIHSVNGNTIYNSHPNYIDLYCSYYKNGVKIDVQQELEASDKSSTLRWYIRSAGGEGWILLDGTKQEDGADYDYSTMFEIHRYTAYDPSYNIYATEPTLSSRGGFYLRVHPSLITGSNVIKAVFTPSDDNLSYSALEVVHDMTDDIQAYIHSSNGDKIYQGANSIGTTLTCMIKYQGELLAATDERYENNFEYYWFKVSSDGSQTWNIWADSTGALKSQLVTGDLDSSNLKASNRMLHINANDVDNVNMFQCAVVDLIHTANEFTRRSIITNSPSEDDIIAASLLVAQLGLEDDPDEILNTAYEINATNIANGNSLTE